MTSSERHEGGHELPNGPGWAMEVRVQTPEEAGVHVRANASIDYDIPLDPDHPGPKAGDPITVGELKTGNRFYLRGELPERVRVVLEISGEAGDKRPEIRTQQRGLRFRLLRTSRVWRTDLPPDDLSQLQPERWPWVAQTFRRLSREDKAGTRVDPAWACPTCGGRGHVPADHPSRVICGACEGSRTRGG